MDIDVINLVVVLIIGLANLIAVPFVKTLVCRIKELETKNETLTRELSDFKVKVSSEHEDFKNKANVQHTNYKLEVSKNYMSKDDIKELITSNLKRIIDRVKPLEQLLNDR